MIAAFWKGWPGQWFRAWAGNSRIAVRCSSAARVCNGADCRRPRPARGGVPPLAPGFLRAGWQTQLLRAFSWLVNGYWSLARRWIG
jgi:hypothetical protein